MPATPFATTDVELAKKSGAPAAGRSIAYIFGPGHIPFGTAVYPRSVHDAGVIRTSNSPRDGLDFLHGGYYSYTRLLITHLLRDWIFHILVTPLLGFLTLICVSWDICREVLLLRRADGNGYIIYETLRINFGLWYFGVGKRGFLYFGPLEDLPT